MSTSTSPAAVLVEDDFLRLGAQMSTVIRQAEHGVGVSVLKLTADQPEAA